MASFPVIDVFSPKGNFRFRAPSLKSALSFIERDARSQHSGVPRRDSLSSIAQRYSLDPFDVSRFQSAYTVLIVTAPQCHACEIEQISPEHPDSRLALAGINEIVLTLRP